MNNSKVLALLAVAAMPAGCGNGDQEAPGAAARAEGDAAVWGTSGNLLVCTGRGLLVVDLERSGSMTQDAQKQAASAIAGSALSRLEPDR
jgi:hypothetical protein